jgi:small subunit ribosomal protein S1
MNSNDEVLEQSQQLAAEAAQVNIESSEPIAESEEIPPDLPEEAPEEEPVAEAVTSEEVEDDTSTEVIVEGDNDEELFRAFLEGNVPGEEEPADFSFTPLKRGQIVKGMVASVSEDEILVDVGLKSEGIISSRDLERLDKETWSSLEIGSEIYVYVITPEDRNGYAQLSLRRALEEQDWREAEEYLEDGRTYQSKIAAFNKGGLIVRFGKVRGFVPASHVSRDRRQRSNNTPNPEDRWGGMVGDDILVKVIEVDRRRNRLILSERAAEKESRALRRTELLNSLEVGQLHKGRVISLADFGAFVDLGGADGLVHLSELSWRHVTHPKEVLKVGDEIDVEIIHIDRDRQRIGLSRRKCLEDPWTSLAREYRRGQLVQGTVTKLTKFGAFAQLVDRPEIEGLIHISELSENRVTHPRDVVEENQVLTLRIIRIDTERRRLGLSLRRVDMEEYLDADWQDVVTSANEDDYPDEAYEDDDVETPAEAEAEEAEANEEAEAPVEEESEEPVETGEEE